MSGFNKTESISEFENFTISCFSKISIINFCEKDKTENKSVKDKKSVFIV
jgi:hypothetical protein